MKIINVYDRNYDPTQFNLSRKEAMLNFYVIDQKGNKHKNLDAMLFLYWHAGKFPDEGWSSVVGILFYHWHAGNFPDEGWSSVVGILFYHWHACRNVVLSLARL